MVAVGWGGEGTKNILFGMYSPKMLPVQFWRENLQCVEESLAKALGKQRWEVSGVITIEARDLLASISV